MNGPAERRAARPGTPWTAIVLGLVALCILLGLGTWQLQRLAWKEDLLASINRRVQAAPETLSQLERRFAETGDVDYWPVVVEGRFNHAQERHFLATHQGRSGFFVYAPLILPDGRAVLVNRGFVPYDRKLSSTRPEGQVEGDVRIKGLARNPLEEKPSFLLPDNDLRANIFFWKDRDAMARSAGLDPARLVPFFVDADDAANPGGLPVGGVTIIDLPNNHLQYAVTWYGLAAALGIVLVLFVRQGRRSS